MKKILNILRAITLIGTSTTSLVACNAAKYTPKELAKLKKENNINTKDGILELITPQENPFKEVNNKWYFVVWRSDTGNNWRIIKFLNDTNSKKELDSYGRYKLIFKEYSPFYDFTLLIRGERGDTDHTWKNGNGTYFKSVYRWDNDNEPNIDVENKLKNCLNL